MAELKHNELITVDNLDDAQKREIINNKFLHGKKMENSTVKTTPKILFQVNKLIPEWRNVMFSQAEKKIYVSQSKDVFQQTLAENSCFSTEVQAGVKEICNVTVGYEHGHEKEMGNRREKISFMAMQRLSKGIINIDNDAVTYSDDFRRDINALLKQKSTNQKDWKELTDKYGLFYISECAIGGSVYYSTMETVNNSNERHKTNTEIKAGFRATIFGCTASNKNVNKDASDETINKSGLKKISQFLCHGGAFEVCNPNQYEEWARSINVSHEAWDIIEIMKIKPFYYLLDVSKQQQIKKLMPKFPEVKYEPFEPDEKEIIDYEKIKIEHRGKTAQQLERSPNMNCCVRCIITITNKTEYELKYGSVHMYSGQMEVQPKDIKCGESTCCALRKTHSTACGAVGVLQFEMNGQFIQVMISAPYNHDYYYNYMAVGVSDKSKYKLATHNTYSELYYKSPKKMDYVTCERIKSGQKIAITHARIGQIEFNINTLHKSIATLTFTQK